MATGRGTKPRQVRCEASLEMPARKQACAVSEDPEALGLPHTGHLGVGECVNCPCCESLLGGSWKDDSCAAQGPHQLKKHLQVPQLHSELELYDT